MDECSPYGLSVTADIKIYQWWKGNNITSPNGEVPYGPLSSSYFCCSNLITVATLQLEINRFVKAMWLSVMTSLPPQAEYPMDPFKWGLPVFKFDVPSTSVTGDM